MHSWIRRRKTRTGKGKEKSLQANNQIKKRLGVSESWSVRQRTTTFLFPIGQPAKTLQALRIKLTLTFENEHSLWSTLQIYIYQPYYPTYQNIHRNKLLMHLQMGAQKQETKKWSNQEKNQGFRSNWEIAWWRSPCGPGGHGRPCRRRWRASCGRHGTRIAWPSGAGGGSSRRRIPVTVVEPHRRCPRLPLPVAGRPGRVVLSPLRSPSSFRSFRLWILVTAGSARVKETRWLDGN